jgi:hypothetical protein
MVLTLVVPESWLLGSASDPGAGLSGLEVSRAAATSSAVTVQLPQPSGDRAAPDSATVADPATSSLAN